MVFWTNFSPFRSCYQAKVTFPSSCDVIMNAPSNYLVDTKPRCEVDKNCSTKLEVRPFWSTTCRPGETHFPKGHPCSPQVQQPQPLKQPLKRPPDWPLFHHFLKNVKNQNLQCFDKALQSILRLRPEFTLLIYRQSPIFSLVTRNTF